jgi:hypothetical protein
MRYYKATQPDGTDFHTGTVDWAGALTTGEVVRHPNPHRVDASGYLSVSTVPTDCTGMRWPCRLLAVEPVGRVWTPDRKKLPHKRSAPGWRVIAELPATDALGPQGPHVAALIERAGRLTPDDARRLSAARDAARDAAWSAVWYAVRYAARSAARDAAWDAAWYAARDAARYAAWDAAGGAAGDAVGALVVRDVIGRHGFTQDHYDTLTCPWREVIGLDVEGVKG